MAKREAKGAENDIHRGKLERLSTEELQEGVRTKRYAWGMMTVAKEILRERETPKK